MINEHPKRILFVSPPFVAHVNPLASISTILLNRGHDVAWVTYDSYSDLVPPGVEFYAVPEDEAYAQLLENVETHSTRFLAEGFVFFYRDIVAPLCLAMLPTVEAAIAGFKPDVIVADQHGLAGAYAGRRHGIPWVTSSPSAQLLTDLYEYVKGMEWLNRTLGELQVRCGMDPIDNSDLSPYLVLVYTTKALAGSKRAWPEHYKFVGSSVAQRVEDVAFPWDQLQTGPRVLVSLGSIVGIRGKRFLETVVEALGDQPIQVIISDTAEVLHDPPANIIVRPWLPQLKLLAEMDAVVTHGGSTVNEALAFGLPLVVAPVTNDNFTFAAKVVEAGAGIRVRFGRVQAAELRRAVFDVLQNPSYGVAAQQIRDSFLLAGGSDAAATAIEALVG